jgi:hypothetical protein
VFFGCSSHLPGILLSSQVFVMLRSMMLEKVLGVGVVGCWLYLATKPPRVGIDAYGLFCPRHHLSACGCWPGVQSSWFEIVLPYLVTKLFLRESLPPQAHRL